MKNDSDNIHLTGLPRKLKLTEIMSGGGGTLRSVPGLCVKEGVYALGLQPQIDT